MLCGTPGGMALADDPAADPAGGLTGDSATKVVFNRDVRPILSDLCFQCHGPDEKKREGGLRLDLRDAAQVAGAGVHRSLAAGCPADDLGPHERADGLAGPAPAAAQARPPGLSELSGFRGAGETSRHGKGLAGSCRQNFKIPTDLYPALPCRHTASLPARRPLESL